MDNPETLENQSWALFSKLRFLVFNEPNCVTSIRFTRLSHAFHRSYDRYQRRQQKLFNYQPGGFASSSAHPSGVTGQGALSKHLDFSGWDEKLDAHKKICNFGILPKPDSFQLSGVVEQGAL